jgi:hypothetical protein
VSVLEGAKGATIENGVLVVDSDSSLAITESILCKYDESYKFNLIKATKDGQKLEVKTYNIFRDPGVYKISVTLFDPEKGIEQEQLDCTLGQPIPEPPKPGPSPPTPVPDDAKLVDPTVLVVYESALLPTYNGNQRAIISNVDFRNWAAKTIGNPTQVTFSVLDKNTPFPSKCDTVFCKWLGMINSGELKVDVPCLIVGNKSKIVYHGPIPDGIEKTKELILKYKK